MHPSQLSGASVAVPGAHNARAGYEPNPRTAAANLRPPRAELRRMSMIFNCMVEHRAGALDKTFAALAHPTRRAIVRQLRFHDHTVSEIAAVHPMSLAAVAKHLDVLERAGLVRRTRVGREKRCSLVPKRLAAAQNWLEDYTAFWERQVGALSAHLQRQR